MLKRLIVFVVSGLFVIYGKGYTAQTSGVGFEGIRADGMGGAYTAIGEGYEGIFYNPAGLTKMKSGNLILPSLYLKGNQDAVTYLLNRKDSAQYRTKEDVSKLIGLVGSSKGTVLAGIIKPSWALNFYTVADAVFFCADMGPDFHYLEDWYIQTDIGAIFSLAGGFPKIIPLLDISWGVNLKYIYRQAINMGFAFDYEPWYDGLWSYQTQFDPQHGWGIDAGVMCKVLGFVDVGVMFRDIFARVGADTVPMNMAIGASTKLLNFITLSMDFVDLTSAQGDFLDKVKIGAEVNLLGFLKVRGGLSQKFPTLGAGITFLFLNVDYAFMGEKPIGQGGQALTQNSIGSHAVSCSLIF